MYESNNSSESETIFYGYIVDPVAKELLGKLGFKLEKDDDGKIELNLPRGLFRDDHFIRHDFFGRVTITNVFYHEGEKYSPANPVIFQTIHWHGEKELEINYEQKTVSISEGQEPEDQYLSTPSQNEIDNRLPDVPSVHQGEPIDELKDLKRENKFLREEIEKLKAELKSQSQNQKATAILSSLSLFTSRDRRNELGTHLKIKQLETERNEIGIKAISLVNENANFSREKINTNEALPALVSREKISSIKESFLEGAEGGSDIDNQVAYCLRLFDESPHLEEAEGGYDAIGLDSKEEYKEPSSSKRESTDEISEAYLSLSVLREERQKLRVEALRMQVRAKENESSVTSNTGIDFWHKRAESLDNILRESILGLSIGIESNTKKEEKKMACSLI